MKTTLDSQESSYGGASSNNTGRHRRRSSSRSKLRLIFICCVVVAFTFVVSQRSIRKSVSERLKPSVMTYDDHSDELTLSMTVSEHSNNSTDNPFFDHTRLQQQLPAATLDREWTQHLVDFSVAGFQKCGTSFLLNQVFKSSSQVFMAEPAVEGIGKEVHYLQKDRLQDFVDLFLRNDTVVPNNRRNTTTANNNNRDGGAPPILKGYKNPGVFLHRKSLMNLETYFPKTKFIVSVRHPVMWFQSWYNFKLRAKASVPPVNETIGICDEQCPTRNKPFSGTLPRLCHPAMTRNIGCSGQGNYHQFLSRLGWTPMDTNEELSLLDHHRMSIHNFSETKLLLFEAGQLDGKKEAEAKSAIRDMEDFLGLEEGALPKLKRMQPTIAYKDRLGMKDGEGKKVLDICLEEYVDIRKGLLEVGRKASEWIERYFLESPQVVVSSQEDFLNRIRQWKTDPCLLVEQQENRRSV